MNRKNCFSVRLMVILFLGSVVTLVPAAVAELAVPPSEQRPAETSLRETATFNTLKKKFPGPLLTDEFKTLRKLSEDRVYLAFLSETYAPEKPFQTYEGFLKNVLPAKERYLTFFQKHLNIKTVDEITDEDLRILHKMAEKLWELDVRQLHGEEIDESMMIPFLADTLMTKEVQEWMVQREIVTQANAGTQLGQFFLNLMLSNLQIVISDIKAVKTRLETYGQDDGLIRLAIEKPVLFGRILAYFTEPEIFLKWTEMRRIQ